MLFNQMCLNLIVVISEASCTNGYHLPCNGTTPGVVTALSKPSSSSDSKKTSRYACVQINVHVHKHTIVYICTYRHYATLVELELKYYSQVIEIKMISRSR